MSSTTRLLVLGVVRLFQPVHGYDVRRELISWHAEEWANVAPGSIYSALKTLERDGAIEVAGTAKVGERPERTTYQITPRGIGEMMELLRETLWQVQMPVDPLVAAISLMWFLDRKEMISALEARTAKINGNLAHTRMISAAIDDIETPIHVKAMMQLMDARLEAELAWSEQFRADLSAGKYRCKGDPGWVPPGLENGPKGRAVVPTEARPRGMKSDVHAGPGGLDHAAAKATAAAHSAQNAAAKAATKLARAQQSASAAATKIARATSVIDDRATARVNRTRAAIARAKARKKRT